MKGALATYRTKGYLVYEALRQALLAGRYQPGARVNIDQLAVELGTSKVPIREAIGRLVGEGWLQMSPHVGAVVPELSPQDIIETSIIRSVTEGAAVRFSASHLTDATLKTLRKLMARMDEAAKIDAPEYPQLNMEFHAATFSACPFPTLKALATSLLEKSGRSANRAVSTGISARSPGATSKASPSFGETGWQERRANHPPSCGTCRSAARAICAQ